MKGLDEKRINALEHLRIYQKRIKKVYGKNITPREFKFGDLVLEENNHNIKAKKEDKGKFDTNCMGLYIISAKYSN